MNNKNNKSSTSVCGNKINENRNYKMINNNHNDNSSSNNKIFIVIYKI